MSELTNEQDIKLLQERRKCLWAAFLRAKTTLDRVHKVCEHFETQLNSAKDAYEKCDKQLALIDGRTQRVQEAKEARKKVVELTKDQILQIAKQLGIEIKEGGD